MEYVENTSEFQKRQEIDETVTVHLSGDVNLCPYRQRGVAIKKMISYKGELVRQESVHSENMKKSIK